MTLYDNYIKSVEDGSIITGELVKLGIKRHLNDLKRANTEDFPFVFDREKADKVISFMQKLRLTGGKYQGVLWDVQPFQAFYFAMVYGWVHRDTGYRRFKKVYWCTGRKSAKSEKTGGEELWHLLADGEGSPQIHCVATTRDQAKYVYDAARYMLRQLIKDSRIIAKIAKVQQYVLYNRNNEGKISCLTADPTTNDGGNSQFASIDEYHAHVDSSMYDVVETGMVMRDQPIIKVTTTAGNNKAGPDYKMRKLGEQLLRGDIIDESWFVMIYEMDKDDDWHDENNWYKPNPLMPISPKIESMRGQYTKAVNEGGETMVQFLTKNLNQYTDSADTWIESEVYAKCANYRDKDSLIGLECVVGVDLASEQDTTAVNYLFYPQQGLDKYYYFTEFYCPEDKFKTVRVDGVLYSEFGDWLRRTDGNVIDAELISSDILANAEKYKIKLVGYDPFKAVDLITKLVMSGLDCAKVIQSPQILGMGNSMWLKLLLSGQVEHDGSPVMRWQMANVEMYTDGNGNQKIVKGKGKVSKKVDGPVSVSNSFVALLDVLKTKKEIGVDEIGEL